MNKTLAHAYYLAVAILSIAGLVAALWFGMGFDVRDLRWWQWLWSYYATQDTLPPRFLWIAGAWFVLSVAAVALCPLATGPLHYGKASLKNGGIMTTGDTRFPWADLLA